GLRFPTHVGGAGGETDGHGSRLRVRPGDVVEVELLREPFEGAPAPVAEGDVGAGADEVLDDLGDEDFSAGRLRRDAGGGMDGLAVQVAVLVDDLAGVEADPDLEAGPLEAGGRCPLDGHRAG